MSVDDAAISAQKLLRRHPLGVYPLGNSLLDPGAGLHRAQGLGSYFARLGDDLLLVLLQAMPPNVCACLGRTSAVLHAFCAHEDLWREFCLQAHGRGNPLAWATEGTWRATYVHSYAASGCRKPAAIRRTKVHVYSDVLYRGFVCAAAELLPGWLARETIPSFDASQLTPQEFIQRFERQSCPVLLRGCARAWPAMRDWSKASLLRRFGDVHFACGPCELPLHEFYSYADRNQDDSPMFVFDRFFHERAPDLLQDYEVPDVFRDRDLFDLLGSARPAFRWLLIGNQRSGSKWHIDPNKTSAWNAVVRGKKRWLLLPPGCPPPGVHPSRDLGEVTQPVSLIEWFRNFYGELRRTADQNPAWDLKEGTCGPGDCIFIPCGWWHCVLNLEDDTIAVTQNYASDAYVHSIRRFLRERPEQVSGTSEKATLADRFDAALARARPDLLIEHTDACTAEPTATAQEERLAKSTEDQRNSGPAEGSLEESCGSQAFSFWDHLRSTGKSLAFGAPLPKSQESVNGVNIGECGEEPCQKRARTDCSADCISQADAWLRSF